MLFVWKFLLRWETWTVHLRTYMYLQCKNKYTTTHVHTHTCTTLTHLNTSVFAGTIPMPSPNNDSNIPACYEGWRLAWNHALPYYQRTTTSTNVAWASKGSWYFAGGLRLISGAEYWTEYAFKTPLCFLGLWIFNVSLTLANESSDPFIVRRWSWAFFHWVSRFTTWRWCSRTCQNTATFLFDTASIWRHTSQDPLLLCWEWGCTVSYHLQATEIKNKIVSVSMSQT